MLRFLTAGESHGPSLVGIIEGLPAGFYIDIEGVNKELARRQNAPGRGGRMKIEHDCVNVFSGLRGGLTLGSPLTLQIENRDYANWREQMDPQKTSSGPTVTRPRPGHADYPGAVKYGFSDIRNVIERASARETAMRTAVGAVAKQILCKSNIQIYSRILQLGPLRLSSGVAEPALLQSENDSPYGYVDSGLARQADDLIIECRSQKKSVGGIIEVAAFNLPVGLGSYAHYDRRLDGIIAQALMSIPSVKGVEIGPAFAVATSEAGAKGDSLVLNESQEVKYHGNINGGLAGGVTTGQPLVISCAVKPIPTAMSGDSVDLTTLKTVAGVSERSDTTAVPAIRVVAEAALAWVLLVALLEDGPQSNSPLAYLQR